jgi:dephospho-CoA kinase
VSSAIVGRWGKRVLTAGGEIDRDKVAEIVFADRDELAWLEALLHPRVAAAYTRWRDELALLPSPPAVCVAEVPLLYEAGGEGRFDVVVAVTAPADLRASRSTRSDFSLRDQRLIPDREKVQRADFAYVNDGTVEELDAFVAGVMGRLAAWRASSR